MSACKTGCGAESELGMCFCGPCGTAYDGSPEFADYRDNKQGLDDWMAHGRKSIDEFCTRVRLERQNGRPDATA